MNAAQLAQAITVAHREPGYLRLNLPSELATEAVGSLLAQGLSGSPGIESARLDAQAGQLAIRHTPALCSAGAAAQRLFALLEQLPLEPAMPANEPEPSRSIQGLLDKLRALLLPPAPETAHPLQSKLEPVVASAFTEKAVYNFLNDLTAFYLIKVHWDLITKRWLQTPLAHSNAWLTTFYLMFLLVRYRKSR